MNPLLRYAEILEDVEALQALGYIAPIRCFEDAEAAFDSLGPGDENAPEDEEICPICGGPLEEVGVHDDRRCPDCGTTMTAPEDEYSHPPTDEDRKARLTWRDQA